MNCIIVDDESPSREELKYFINNFSNIKIVNEFDDSIKALEYIEENKDIFNFVEQFSSCPVLISQCKVMKGKYPIYKLFDDMKEKKNH